jgi:hypothetical protein
MRENTGRQRGVAIDQRPVDLESASCSGETVAQHVVFAHAKSLHSLVPQRRERAFGASGQQYPKLPLETQNVPRHALGVVAAGDVLQHAIEKPRNGLDPFAVGSAVDQHEGKVVAQRREVAVAREQRGAQGERFDGLEAGGPSAGQVKGDVRLKFGFHEHVQIL